MLVLVAAAKTATIGATLVSGQVLR